MLNEILNSPKPNFSTPINVGKHAYVLPLHAPLYHTWRVDPSRVYSESCIRHLCRKHIPQCKQVRILDLRPTLPGGPNVVVDAETIEKVVNTVTPLTEGTVVAVHCSHGINRTGIVCCAIMIKNGTAVDSALDTFQAVRGKMRPNAVAALRKWATVSK